MTLEHELGAIGGGAGLHGRCAQTTEQIVTWVGRTTRCSRKWQNVSRPRQYFGPYIVPSVQKTGFRILNYFNIAS
jgi:hypothetical protein